jgi:thioredoxin reductase
LAVESVSVEDLTRGSISIRQTDAVLIRIGSVPNSEMAYPSIKMTEQGYILTDANCMTNKPLVFAIGDVANPKTQSIAVAGGDAAKAVKTAYDLIAASKEL